MDLSAHDVDYIMHVLQDDVVSVYATGTSSTDELAAADIHDNATVMLKFRRGTLMHIPYRVCAWESHRVLLMRAVVVE